MGIDELINENIQKLNEKVNEMRRFYKDKFLHDLRVKVVSTQYFNQVYKSRKDDNESGNLDIRVIYTDGKEAFPAYIDHEGVIRNNFQLIELAEINEQKILSLIFGKTSP